LPEKNNHLKIQNNNKNTEITTPDGSFFSIPTTDVLLLPIENTSSERIAIYLAHDIRNRVFKKFQFEFESLEVELEETRGQSAVFILKKE